ncbi:metalloregulator ArsR/SmtB family transcription factor [Mesorhizobium sp. RMAD-H1]|uniref:ArsR/SmtB family transcription factor n=1 Tax=Mesorhizobium sp. RMAD-H1 TaxID=2587065 RepID=UPI00183EC230|nr:metalloregulator ArsR/SmtB family transcription factor [Mesorhizobium sp. RMAD-H1]MBB2973009.1 DNA-binding transcriptional ArsR family regulator [Mesorhizobium sp. RMAD-H1]
MSGIPDIIEYMENELVFSALAHPVRRRVILLLLDCDRTAGAIAQEFEISRSAVSEHLGVLRQANLVRETKSGRERVYSLNAKPLTEIRNWLEPFETYWKVQLVRLAQQLEEDAE